MMTSRRKNRPLRVVCLTEVALGHNVFVQNLQRYLEADSGGALEAEWIAVHPERQDVLGRIAWLRRHPALLGSAQAMKALFDRRVRPDVLFFHTPTIAQLALPLMPVIPTVVSLDSTQRQFAGMAADYGAQAPGDGATDQAIGRLNGATYRAAAALLPWSEWAARSLRRDYGVRPERIVVNSPGVEIPEPPTRPQEQQHGLVRLLFVGGDFRRKGGFVLLDALRSIAIPWELHVVTGEAVPAVPNVHVYGSLDNRSVEYQRLFASCDVFVLPTLADCHSIASIEGMAAGLPVLSTTVGGIPEIVVDGETGFLAPPGDCDRLRERLVTLLGDAGLRQRMGAAGRRRAEALFSAADRAATVREVIQAVAWRSAAAETLPAGTIVGKAGAAATISAARSRALAERSRAGRGGALPVEPA